MTKPIVSELIIGIITNKGERNNTLASMYDELPRKDALGLLQLIVDQTKHHIDQASIHVALHLNGTPHNHHRLVRKQRHHK
jgi:hypothetical protein